MIFDKIDTIFGFVRICLYKLVFWHRLYFNGVPKIKNKGKIIASSKSKIIFGKKIQIRDGYYLRAEQGGVINIGDGTFINTNANIVSLCGIKIGKNVSIGQNCVIVDHDHDYKNNFKNFVKKPVTIGDNVWIGANVTILKGVSIGNNCMIAANTIITKNIGDNTIVREKKEYIFTNGGVVK